MSRLTYTTSLISLSLFLSRVAASPMPMPVPMLLPVQHTGPVHDYNTLSHVSSAVAFASDDGTGKIVGYYKDGSVAGYLPKPKNALGTGTGLQARDGSSCRVMTTDEARGLGGWPAIEAYAKSQWGDGSYNLGTDYNGATALVCVDSYPTALNADGDPSCSTQSSSTGGVLVGTSGSVTISFTQGYHTSSDMTVTQSTTLGSSMTANVGFKIEDLLDVGASATVSTEVTNTSSEGFTVTQDATQTESITMNAPEGKTCHLTFNSKSCSVQGSGNIRYIGSGWIWFNYNDRTHDHYRWAVNIDAIVTDINQKSQTSTVRGLISGSSTSDYSGSCY